MKSLRVTKRLLLGLIVFGGVCTTNAMQLSKTTFNKIPRSIVFHDIFQDQKYSTSPIEPNSAKDHINSRRGNSQFDIRGHSFPKHYMDQHICNLFAPPKSSVFTKKQLTALTDLYLEVNRAIDCYRQILESEGLVREKGLTYINHGKEYWVDRTSVQLSCLQNSFDVFNKVFEGQGYNDQIYNISAHVQGLIDRIKLEKNELEALLIIEFLEKIALKIGKIAARLESAEKNDRVQEKEPLRVREGEYKKNEQKSRVYAAAFGYTVFLLMFAYWVSPSVE